jgi:hypothetical protein
MNIDLLEGAALVSAQNQSQVLIGGQRLQVPVDTNFRASGAPSLPQEIPADAPRLPLPEFNEETASPTESTTSPRATHANSSRPALPTGGACVLRSFEEEGRPNVRSRPSTDAGIVSYILPTELYPVIGRTAENDWYQIGTGWIAGFVTERGGDCSRVPITYVPPTPTPMPTATPSLPIAGNNEFAIRIDASMRGTQHSLTGAISSPQGDSRDTVSYTVFNTGHSNNSLQYSVRCTGTGVEHAYMIFSDGSTRDCSATASNFLDVGFNRTSETITIAFDSGVGNAYVTWEMSFSVVAQ